jgi:hypothetical protein
MDFLVGLRRPGVLSALGAALLFGAGTPLAKLLLNEVSPWMLAGLLYLGSGIWDRADALSENSSRPPGETTKTRSLVAVGRCRCGRNSRSGAPDDWTFWHARLIATRIDEDSWMSKHSWTDFSLDIYYLT